MILKDFDLSPCAGHLDGDPGEFFAETFGDAVRIVRHADGVPTHVLVGDRIAPHATAPDPAAPAIVGTLDHKARPSRMDA